MNLLLQPSRSKHRRHEILPVCKGKQKGTQNPFKTWTCRNTVKTCYIYMYPCLVAEINYWPISVVWVELMFIWPTRAEHLTPHFLLHEFPKTMFFFFLNCRFSCCLIRENQVAVWDEVTARLDFTFTLTSRLNTLKPSVYARFYCTASEKEHWYQVCHFWLDGFWTFLNRSWVYGLFYAKTLGSTSLCSNVKCIKGILGYAIVYIRGFLDCKLYVQTFLY